MSPPLSSTLRRTPESQNNDTSEWASATPSTPLASPVPFQCPHIAVIQCRPGDTTGECCSCARRRRYTQSSGHAVPDAFGALPRRSNNSYCLPCFDYWIEGLRSPPLARHLSRTSFLFGNISRSLRRSQTVPISQESILNTREATATQAIGSSSPSRPQTPRNWHNSSLTEPHYSNPHALLPANHARSQGPRLTPAYSTNREQTIVQLQFGDLPSTFPTIRSLQRPVDLNGDSIPMYADNGQNPRTPRNFASRQASINTTPNSDQGPLNPEMLNTIDLRNQRIDRTSDRSVVDVTLERHLEELTISRYDEHNTTINQGIPFRILRNLINPVRVPQQMGHVYPTDSQFSLQLNGVTTELPEWVDQIQNEAFEEDISRYSYPFEDVQANSGVGPIRPSLDGNPNRPPPVDDAELMVDSSCRVCLSQLMDIIMIPCYHLCVCRWCAQSLIEGLSPHDIFTCPVCRAQVSRIERVFRA